MTGRTEPKPDQVVAHLDMDAFYAAVEVHDDPRLEGLPVIVGGSPDGGRGVVCSATYEARAFGVRSAMPAAVAKRLCPRAVFVRGNMARYEQISNRIFQILREFTPLVQPLSVDEAFLGLRGFGGFDAAVEIMRKAKQAIRDRIGLTASVGVAPNKSLAKIASDLEKPDGFVIVRPGTEQVFLDPLAVSRIWGVGPRTEESLARLGIHTVKDLRAYPRDVLERRLGKWGGRIHHLALGRDDRDVEEPSEGSRGSLSAQSTFGTDLHAWADLEEALLALSERVASRARAKSIAGRTVTLRARYPDFRTVTRNRTLDRPTRATADLYRHASDLLRILIRPGDAFRLLGVGLSQLTDRVVIQGDLFASPDDGQGERIDRALDKVRAEAGEGALFRARLMGRRRKR